MAPTCAESTKTLGGPGLGGPGNSSVADLAMQNGNLESGNLRVVEVVEILQVLESVAGERFFREFSGHGRGVCIELPRS